MKWFSSPVIDFYSGGKLNKEEWFDGIIDTCDDMESDDSLHIYDFGSNRDLILDIYKDADYDGEDSFNIVSIVTSQFDTETGMMLIVDDTGDVYITDGSLYRELERIWNYENFGTL